jgi:hypothetical protein
LSRKRDKTIAHVEIAGLVAFGVHKQTYAPGLVSDENGPMDRLCDQKAPISFALMPERYREAGEAHCGKAVFGIHDGVRRRKMFCCNLAKRKGNKPYNGGGLVTFSEYKGPGEPFFSRLPGRGLKKGVQFGNAAIKGRFSLRSAHRRIRRGERVAEETGQPK